MKHRFIVITVITFIIVILKLKIFIHFWNTTVNRWPLWSISINITLIQRCYSFLSVIIYSTMVILTILTLIIRSSFIINIAIITYLTTPINYGRTIVRRIRYIIGFLFVFIIFFKIIKTLLKVNDTFFLGS